MTTRAQAGFEMIQHALEKAGFDVEELDDYDLNTTCPLHDDHEPSLSVQVKDKGEGDKLYLYCHPCGPDFKPREALRRVWKEAGLKGKDPWSAVREGADFTREHLVVTYSKGVAHHRWDYDDGKTVRNLGEGHHLLNPDMVRAQAKKGGRVFVVEGEMSVYALAQLGEVATTCFGGAGKWDADWADLFAGAKVTVIADKDVPGYKHALDIAKSVCEVAETRVVVSVTDGKGDDVVDHLRAGNALRLLQRVPPEDLKALAAEEVDAPTKVNGHHAADWPNPMDRAGIAQTLKVRVFTDSDGWPLLRRWQSGFYRYSTKRAKWVPISDEEVVAWVSDKLEHAWWTNADGDPKPYLRTTSMVKDVTAMLGAQVIIESQAPMGAWLTKNHEWDDSRPPARSVFLNGVLDLEDLTVDDTLGPQLFNHSIIPFRVDAAGKAKCKAWLKFLHNVFPDDQESIDCLQEWFGYVLSGDTSRQLAMFLHGASGTGKGVIQRTLARLVGEQNASAVSLSSLSMSDFAMENSIGKLLTTIGEAKFSVQNPQTVVAKLQEWISGEPTQVNRKNKTAITTSMTARLMMASNDLPQFKDATLALGKRLLVLHTPGAGHRDDPDITLDDQMASELEGILLWSLVGWVRLQARGGFTHPASSESLIEDMASFAAPVVEFWRDSMVPAETPGQATPRIDVYGLWRTWCEAHGEHPGSSMQFANNLRQARLIGSKRQAWVAGGKRVVYFDRSDRPLRAVK